MSQYISLQNLPGAPKGTVWEFDEVNNIYQPNNLAWSYELRFTENFLKAHPEWFELVKQETLEEAVGKVLIAWNVKVGHNDSPLGWSLENLRAVYERVKGERI